MSQSLPWTLVLVMTAAIHAGAQGVMSIDLLTPGDIGYQPIPDLYCVDIHIDTDPADMWTASGLRGVTVNSATLVYAPDDPNTGRPMLINPGTENRFTTFFSKPRGRNSVIRFTEYNAAIAGRYDPTSPVPVATPTEINAAWFGFPPEDYFATDGYIARIAIRAEGFSLDGMNATPLDEMPSDATALFLSTGAFPPSPPGTVFATWRIPAPQGFDWAIWYIPEPACPIFVLSLGLLARTQLRHVSR
ncbi:MAG: hypothetical protein IT450_13500 [Phycisphaerales bacterium]|nr:hypothetical protein [Phycisphaerales bacterium]